MKYQTKEVQGPVIEVFAKLSPAQAELFGELAQSQATDTGSVLVALACDRLTHPPVTDSYAHELSSLLWDHVANGQLPKSDEGWQISERAQVRKAQAAPLQEKFDGTKMPPMPDQVQAYSASIGYPIDGWKWCDFYQAKNWKRGSRHPMKDWCAVVREWKRKRWGIGTIALAEKR